MTTALLLSACSNIPEKLAVPDGTNLANYSTENVIEGEQARWGGIIAKVENLPNKTRLEIVNFDLRNSLRPKQSNETKGRFRVYSDQLLDPMIYKVGKSITVLGVISAREQGKIGEHEYAFPVLQAKGIQLWKNIEQYNVQMLSDPFWDSPYLYPPFYPNYRRSTVIVTKQNGQMKTPSIPKNNTRRLK